MMKEKPPILEIELGPDCTVKGLYDTAAERESVGEQRESCVYNIILARATEKDSASICTWRVHIMCSDETAV